MRTGGDQMTHPLRLTSARCAIVTMEMQRGVVGDVSSIPQLARAVAEGDVIGRAAALCDASRSLGVPIIHCLAGFRGDRAGTPLNAPLIRALLREPTHLLLGSPAVSLVPELGPEPTDLTSLRMHGVSPFGGTGLDGDLRALGASTIIVAGVSVNLGVVGLAIEAVNLGYEVVIARDAVAGVDQDYVDAVMDQTLRLIARIADVDDIITALGG
jgi:nicotinamidase-related amidase